MQVSLGEKVLHDEVLMRIVVILLLFTYSDLSQTALASVT